MECIQTYRLRHVAHGYDGAYLELPELVGADEQVVILAMTGNYDEHGHLSEKVAMCLNLIDYFFPLPPAR